MFTFWLGLGMSIPVSLAVNLLTPFFQRELTKVSSGFRQRQARKRRNEEKLAARLSHSDRRLMMHIARKNAYITRLMIYSVLFALLGFAGAILFVLYQVAPVENDKSLISGFVVPAWGVIGLLGILASMQVFFFSARERSRLYRILELVTDSGDVAE
jgi:heme exporter protein D